MMWKCVSSRGEYSDRIGVNTADFVPVMFRRFDFHSLNPSNRDLFHRFMCLVRIKNDSLIGIVKYFDRIFLVQQRKEKKKNRRNGKTEYCSHNTHVPFTRIIW